MAIYPPSSSTPRSAPHSSPAKALSAQREVQLANLKVEAKIRIEGTVNALVKQITPLSPHQRQALFADISDTSKETVKPTSAEQRPAHQQSNKPKSFTAKTQLFLAEIKLKNIQQLVVTNKALVIGELIRVKLSPNNQLQIVEANPSNTSSTKPNNTGKTLPAQKTTQTDNQSLPLTSQKPGMTSTSNKAQLGLAIESLKEALPKQSPANNLIALAKNLSALPQEALDKILLPQQKKMIDEIARIPLTPEQLKNPQALKQLISNSGIFLESKINNFNKKNENTVPVTKPQTQKKNIATDSPIKTVPQVKNQEPIEKTLIRPLTLNKTTIKPDTFSIPKVASRKPMSTAVNTQKPPVETSAKTEIELKTGWPNSPKISIGQKSTNRSGLTETENQQRMIITGDNKQHLKTQPQTLQVKMDESVTRPIKTNLNGAKATSELPQKSNPGNATSAKQASENTLEKSVSVETKHVKTAQTQTIREQTIPARTIQTQTVPTQNVSGKTVPEIISPRNTNPGNTKLINDAISPSKNVHEDQKSILLLAKELFGAGPIDTTESTPKNFSQVLDKHGASNLDKLLKPFLNNLLNTSTNETEHKEPKSNRSVQELQQQLFAQIRNSVGATLARLQVLQVQSLMTKMSGAESSQPNVQQLQTEIPVQYQNSTHQVGIELEEEWINKDGSASEDEESKSRRWSVMLSFKLPEKGEFYAKLRIVEETVSVQFWADKIETLQLAEKNITPLYQELSTQGVHIEDIQCIPGKPPTKKIKMEYSLVDLRT